MPPGPVTVTETVPPLLSPCGTTTFITVLEITVKGAAVEPKFAAVVFMKPMPVMTAVFPPLVGLDIGLIPVTNSRVTYGWAPLESLGLATLTETVQFQREQSHLLMHR